MRITFVLPCLSVNGGTRVVALHAKGLMDRGHHVEVVAPAIRQEPAGRKVRQFLRGGGWPPRWESDPSFFRGMGISHRELSRWRPVTDADVPDADVVVATWWETAPWVAALSPRKGAKAYFMQDYGAAGQPLESVVPTWELPLHLVTIAPWLATMMREHVGPRRPIDVVLNAVELERFDAPVRDKQAMPTVGYLYALIPEKGGRHVAAAAAQARQKLPELRVVTFGSGQRDRTRVPMPEPVEDLGRVGDAELPTVYGRCDAWIFPSDREGFGLPILEAMACRTPVIATRAGVAPDVVNEGNGILLPDGDDAVIAAAMSNAILNIAGRSNAAWRAMSDAARQTVTRYTWADATAALEAALYRAVEGTTTTAHTKTGRSGHE